MAGRRQTASDVERGGADLRASISLLRALGLAPWTIEYYRQQGRKAGRLPHELVVAAAAAAARSIIAAALSRTSTRAGGQPDGRQRGERTDRRVSSLAGVMRRQMFDASLGLLTQCGFDPWTVQCYRDASPSINVLPHDLVRFAVETIAWHRLNRESRGRRQQNGGIDPVLLLRNSIGGIGPVREEAPPRRLRAKEHRDGRRQARWARA